VVLLTEVQREEEEKGQSIESNQSIITMAKASPEDLKALFDTQQGYARAF